MRRSGWPARRATRWLIALCAVAAGLEASLVHLLGPPDAIAAAPQISALAPVATYHDLRWLFVFNDSWLSFAAEAAALVVFRTAFTAACVRLSWPQNRQPLSWRRLCWRSFSITLTAAILLFPVAALLFGMAVVSVSYFFLGAAPIAVVVFLFTAHGSTASWWRNAPTPAAIAWAGLDLLTVTVAGALVVATPAPLDVLVATAGGAANALAWRGLVRSMVLPERRLRFRPVAPAALAALFGLVVATVTVVIALHQPGGSRAIAAAARRRPPPTSSVGQPVLLVTGFGAGWNGRESAVLGPGFDVRRFSYRGLSRDGRPLPYTGAQTEQSITSLVRLMSRQVQVLARATGRPVSIVAASEGALAAKAYLVANPDAPVARLVMLSPLLDPARVYFPPPNATGWGMVAGDSVRAVLAGLDATTPLTLRADGPLVRSIDNHAGDLRNLVGCQLPRVHQLALIPLADAAGAPYGQDVAIPSAIVVAFHGTLIGQPQVDKLTREFLTGRLPQGYQWRSVVERALRAMSTAWQMPSLPIALNPAWSASGSSCSAISAGIRSWLSAPRDRPRAARL
ncbi:MAG: esterase/lipase family protein [Mycobacteriales bacterium]